MTLVRRLARPMLASVFVVQGASTLRNPGPPAAKAHPVLRQLSAMFPQLPQEPEQLVRLNSAVHVIAGGTLALGIFPRLSAAALAASVVPTTFGGHQFWQEDDPAARKQQRIQFLKNVGLLGGLLLAAVDTEGRPSVAYRAERVSRRARRTAEKKARRARKVTAAKVEAVRDQLPLVA
jgi:putative oxidoreductase